MIQRHAAEYELRSMTSRMLELERERTDARDQVRALIKLHEALSAIAVERRARSVIELALRAAHDPLDFGRAFFIETNDGQAKIRYASHAFDDVVELGETLEPMQGGAISRLLADPMECLTGHSGELGAPLVDTRGWYALVALQRRDGGTFGLLYLDAHRHAEPREWHINLVRTLAAIAGIALENTELFERLELQASNDPLTGLLNRRAFGDRFAQAIEHAKKTGRGVALALIDVDDFKKINDSGGHAHGDAVLRLLAQTLQTHCRAHDVAGRFAGDEFVLALSDIDATHARHVIGRLSNRLSEQRICCSIGVSLYPNDAADATSLFEASDRALYSAKASGKNTFRFANLDDDLRAEYRT